MQTVNMFLKPFSASVGMVNSEFLEFLKQSNGGLELRKGRAVCVKQLLWGSTSSGHLSIPWEMC